MSQKKHCKPYNDLRRGMTLIELLIAVVVIGIISAFAYPAYQDYVLKSHRTTALSDIMRMQLALEQSYDTSTSTYDLSSVYSSGSCTICETNTSRYDISAVSDASGYKIKAKALSTLGQDKDPCFSSSEDTLSMTAANVRAPTACWQ